MIMSELLPRVRTGKHFLPQQCINIGWKISRGDQRHQFQKHGKFDGLKEVGVKQMRTERRKTYGRRWKLEEWGTPQGEELWWIHSVLNGVLLLLVNPAHVDDLSSSVKEEDTDMRDMWGVITGIIIKRMGGRFGKTMLFNITMSHISLKLIKNQFKRTQRDLT